jgi:hypothetical protein
MAQVGQRAAIARAQSGAGQAIGRGTGGLHLQSGGQLGGKRLMAGSCPEPAARSQATMEVAWTGGSDWSRLRAFGGGPGGKTSVSMEGS